MKSALIITSIAAPNAAMKAFAKGAMEKDVEFIVIGDTKSPADFQLESCTFYSIEKQLQLDIPLAKALPVKHYSRKNIGYLLAKKADYILETDDDNFPKSGIAEFPLHNFFKNYQRDVFAEQIESNGWINAYQYFTSKHIWPRGFPMEELHSQKNVQAGRPALTRSPIQQSLADENPDVDAVYRMTMPLPVDFENRPPIALGKNAWCPFNSQNTIWFKEAFPLLYLPSFCTFRMTDIWRSFIAQRIAWTNDWNITFHSATVWQERNEHNLLRDFEDEIPGYLNNAEIRRILSALDLKPGEKNISENMIRCYEALTQKNIIGKEEMKLLELWLREF